MYSFAGAAATVPQAGDRSNRNYCSQSGGWRLEAEIMVITGLVPPEASLLGLQTLSSPRVLT